MSTRVELRNVTGVRARSELGERFVYVDATFEMDDGRSHQKIAFLFDKDEHVKAARLAQALNHAFSHEA